MKKKVLLITGADGVVGSELLHLFHKQGDFDLIFAFLHSASHKNIPATKGIRFLYGDVTKDNLGLSFEDYSSLSKTVTAIIHSAANVSFSLPLEAAMKINYQGTINVTRFGESCNHLEKYAAISTAYVSGRRTGLIKEDELVHSVGFVNTYEESKYMAEVYLEGKKKSLPLTIFRLSTIFGRASDGFVPKFHGIHFALKLYYHSLAPFIPSSPNSPVDLVSLEFVTETIFHLFSSRFTPGNTYHIVSGRKKTLTIEELIDETYHAFCAYNPQWSKKAIEKPTLIDLPTFNLFSKSTMELDNQVFLHVVSSIETFAPQLLYPKEFDHRKTDLLLQDTQIAARPLREYYGKVVTYCLRTNWGKRMVA